MYVTKQIQNKIQKKKINIHQRSILRQMMSTCDKLGNSFLTKQQSKKFQFKQKQQIRISRKTSLIQKQQKNTSLQRLTHDPFRYYKDNILQDFVYVKQSKQIKQIKDLKHKMLPKVNKTNIQKKLKQLTYIRNMGYKSKNKKLESFKTLTIQQDQQNTINKSWQSFYQDKYYTSPTSTPLANQDMLRSPQKKSTKKPTYIVPKSKFNQSFKQKIQVDHNSKTYNFSSLPTSFIQSCQKTCDISGINMNASTLSNKTLDIGIQLKPQQQPPKRISARNKQVFKQVIQNISKKKKMKKIDSHLSQFPLSCDRRKQITQKIGLTKQKLQKQSAHKLYSLITGGYNLDRTQVQGQYISLNRFKQAKQNFKMLNTCFNKVRQYRYIVQQPHKVFNDESFKSLVYLSQIQNKIAPSTFKKVQSLNRVVN